jgi:hypothetical protein
MQYCLELREVLQQKVNKLNPIWGQYLSTALHFTVGTHVVSIGKGASQAQVWEKWLDLSACYLSVDQVSS